MIAMILAAGVGSRLKPFTDNHPKALAMVNGKTVLQRNVEYVQQAGISKIVVNVHHFAEQIVEAIDKASGWGAEIIVSNESDALLETGGGIRKALPLFGDAKNLLVMNADILTDMDLKALQLSHQSSHADATLAVSNRASTRCFLLDENNQLCGWKNIGTGEIKQPVQASPLFEKSFSGIQILHESIFRHLPFEGKFSMVDAYLHMCATHRILGYDHSGSKFIDIGTMEKLEKAAQLFD
ncbi:MAG TPA: nucleotidyltransferase family protein [Phnomibacter sp.]|nr:nucleotidyltransferase family protein [Phnomibacter sp.]